MNKCPAERMIPIYVLVEGVRGFFSTSINFTKLLFPSNAHFIVALRYFVDCFGLIWLIFGKDNFMQNCWRVVSSNYLRLILPNRCNLDIQSLWVKYYLLATDLLVRFWLYLCRYFDFNISSYFFSHSNLLVAMLFAG